MESHLPEQRHYLDIPVEEVLLHPDRFYRKEVLGRVDIQLSQTSSAAN